MVSAGAISTTALIKGKDEETKWNRVREAFAKYAGKRLPLNQDVVRYEFANSTHSFALANALLTRQLLWYPGPGGVDGGFVAPSADDVGALVRRYLRSTSQDVSVETLALMGATLANGGVNPRTEVRAADRENVLYILSAMVTAGMYDASGEWMSRVGLPAKSGVSGNVLAVLPGRMAIAVYSPPLDASGNSVRGVRVIEDLARRWSLHVLIPDQHAAVENGDTDGD
jgi:glutaminase